MDTSISAARSAAMLSALMLGAAAQAQPLTENLRVTLDAASRGVWMAGANSAASAWFVGMDLHKVFSGERGDIGTLTVQPYVIRLHNMGMHPPFFDGPNDTAIEYRIFNFNYTAWGEGRTNIRVGHFEIPFGLEQVVNTNGTLRDYLHGSNLGVKADWGLTLNGDLQRAEYEVALSRGSGNDWSSRGNPYIASGRIGTPRNGRWVAGASLFQGRVSDATQPDYTTARQRAALDLQWHGPWVDLLAEVSAGNDESRSRRTALLEADLGSASGALSAFLQFVWRDAELSSAVVERGRGTNLGVLFAPDSHWSLSASWSRDRSSVSGSSPSMLAGQLRYRF
jgi:hypothetical protein